MNRFDNISVSAYAPQSFQELAFTPMMKRQKHDEMSKNLAELNSIVTDPLKEHYNEALKIKQEFESKLSDVSGELASKGIDGMGKDNFYKLKKEHDNLVAPTGKIGQINKAKIIYDKSQEEFIQDASKQNIGREQAIKKWKEKTAYYTGFTEDGNTITNVNPQGVAAYQDYNKDKQVAHSILGKTISGLSSSGHHLEVDKSTGGVWEVTQNGKRIQNNNTQQVQNSLKSALDKWDNLSGEGKKWLNDSGEGIDRNRIINDWTSMLDTSDIRDNSETANYNKPDITDSNTKKGELLNDAIQDPNSIKNLNKETGEINFEEIGTFRDTRNTEGYDQTTHSPIYGGSNKIKSTYKNTLTPMQQKFYETAAERLIKSGKLSKNADLNNTDNAKKIGFYMKNYMKFPTIASDIIRADVAIDNKLFSGNLASTDQKSRNATLTQDLRETENGKPLRTMIDVETGKKIKFEKEDQIDYLGVESPINYSNYGFENKFEQSVMGHRAQILDKEGNIKANVVISRTSNEIKDPTFKKMYEINQSYKAGLNKLGEWVQPSGKYSGSKELAKTKIKVNDNGTFQIQINGYPISNELSNGEFIRDMNKIMEY